MKMSKEDIQVNIESGMAYNKAFDLCLKMSKNTGNVLDFIEEVESIHLPIFESIKKCKARAIALSVGVKKENIPLTPVKPTKSIEDASNIVAPVKPTQAFKL